MTFGKTKTRTAFFLVGILVTPIFITLSVWYAHGYAPFLMFPWSGYSMALRKLILPYDSFGGAPWIHELIIALLQFPLYGIYLGRGQMGNAFRDRIIKLPPPFWPFHSCNYCCSTLRACLTLPFPLARTTFTSAPRTPTSRQRLF
jgi:hypothetical protein